MLNFICLFQIFFVSLPKYNNQFPICYIIKLQMPRKKNPNNNYFNSDVEEAIHAYNLSTDERERNKLFSIVYPALCKVAEVWRNKIKPTYVQLPNEELEMDCVTYLLERLPMIKKGKGKAFSYLTVTARNYYIQANQIAYKKRLRGYSLEGMPESFDVPEEISDRVEEMEWNGTLFDAFIQYMDDNFNDMFPASKQKRFGVQFLKKIKSYGIDVEFNRRAMLNELAAETGIERGIITKHVNRIAAFYGSFKEYFETNGTKPRFKEKLHITKEDEAYIRKNYQHYSKRNGLNGISRKLGIKYEVLKKWISQSI